MEDSRVKQVNMVFLATLGCYIVGSSILYYVKENFYITFPVYFQLIYSQLLLILPAGIYMRLHHINIKEFVRIKKINFGTVFLLVLLGFFLRPILSLLSVVSTLWVENQIEDTAKQLLTEVNVWLGLVFIAIIPAFFEEFVYRGVFYNEYRKVSPGKAVLLSGLLFGLMHMNLNQFIYAFFMGAIFALIIEATDSILASVIVHFTINGTTLLFMKITPWLQKQAQKMGETTLLDSSDISRSDILKALPSMAVSALICLGISYLLYLAIAKYNNRIESIKQILRPLEERPQKRSLITAPLAAGIIVCLLFIVINALG